MQSIILKNFKSYEYQSLNNLNSRINIVLGSNGQGKSNFLKAISFLFTDKFVLNKVQFNSTLYRGQQTQTAELSVQAVFHQNRDDQKNGYKISKTWTGVANQRLNQQLKVNNKTRNKGQYEGFIQSFGLSYTNPINIVQQGKISHVALMNQTELYLLLEQTAGVRRFVKKSEQAQHSLERVQNDLIHSEDQLKSLKQKVSYVENRRNQYEYYSIEQKVRKIKRKRDLKNYLQNIKTQISKMKQHHSAVSKELQRTRVNQKRILQQIQQKQLQMRALIEKQVFYKQQNTAELKPDQVNKSQIKKSLTNKKKQLKDLQKQIHNSQKSLQQSQRRLNDMEKELNAYKEKYQTIKLDFEAQGQTKDGKKIKESYETRVKTQRENIKNFQQEIKRIQAMKAEFKLVPYAKQQAQYNKQKPQIQKIQQQRLKNRASQIQLGRNKINLQCQIQTLQSRRKNLDQIIKKILPLIDFRILSLLEQQKVEGVYGYLLQHLKIQEQIAYAYQLSGLSKLCTLIVQNDEVATKIVEINNRIKGKHINILPLSYVRTQIAEKRNYPQMDNVCSIINEDFIKVVQSKLITPKIKSDLQKVIQNTFSKYAIVQDYSLALDISKRYNLNCITPDREIVYAEAITCKVGRQKTYQKGKIQQFKLLQSLNDQLNKKKNQLDIIEKKQVQLQNTEIKLINIKQSLQIKISQFEKTINQGKKIQNVLSKLQQKKVNLNNSIERSKNTIQQYEKALLNIKNNVKSKFKQEDLKKAQNDYFNLKTKVEIFSNDNYQNQKNFANLLRSSQNLKQQILNLQKVEPTFSGLAPKDDIVKQILKSQERIQKEISQAHKNLVSYMQQRQNLRMKQAGLAVQISVQQENIKDIYNQIQSLQEIDEKQQEQIQQLSHSLSLKLNINNQKSHFYTARDKLFFSKLNEFLDKVRYYEQSTIKIRKQKQKLLDYIKKTEQDARTHMKQFITNFQKHFIAYFLRIVPNGKADLRTKIYTQKVKGVNKNAYSLEIKVSFNEEEGIRRWNEFSGGQKTVLALCIILAIQKSEPTLFCVLDEVDAALDSFYANKIIDIIIQESQYCQYFITSFKKTLLDFPEEITNYYFVRSENRISHIQKVEKRDVYNIVDSLAH